MSGAGRALPQNGFRVLLQPGRNNTASSAARVRRGMGILLVFNELSFDELAGWIQLVRGWEHAKRVNLVANPEDGHKFRGVENISSPTEKLLETHAVTRPR